jgi:glycosyltransferase involved in cell wall biosynthesis
VSKRIIFLTLIRIDTIEERGIYHDLLRQFVQNGYDITVVCPIERVTGLNTRVIKSSNLTILQVKTLNIQKCNILEKGLSTISISYLFRNAIKKYFKVLNFDLILYSTPPITLVSLISWLKNVSNAKTYLLLKDIFPQNAIDLKYFKSNGLLHRYFSNTERILYRISDKIGCMSPANMKYLVMKFPDLKAKLEVNPNSIDIARIPDFTISKDEVRFRYGIPVSTTVFLYGGNLGKPQGLDFLMNLVEHLPEKSNIFFLIVGNGAEAKKIHNWIKTFVPMNFKFIPQLPKKEFDELAFSCDVGVIMLRNDFTIPNFPSRLLTYLENKLPVISFTDTVSDIGQISIKEGFGKWSLYGNLEEAVENIYFFEANEKLRIDMGRKGFEFLVKEYDVKLSYNKISKFMNENSTSS